MFTFGEFGMMKRNVFCTRFSAAMLPLPRVAFAAWNCAATKGSVVAGSPLARAMSNRLTVRTVLSVALYRKIPACASGVVTWRSCVCSLGE